MCIRDSLYHQDQPAADFILSAEMCQWLKDQTESGWGDYKNKGMTPKLLGDLLGDFDVKSEKNRASGNKHGYYRSRLVPVWESYRAEILPDSPEQSAPSATSLRGQSLDNDGSATGSTSQSAPVDSGADHEPLHGALHGSRNSLDGRQVADGADHTGVLAPVSSEQIALSSNRTDAYPPDWDDVVEVEEIV